MKEEQEGLNPHFLEIKTTFRIMKKRLREIEEIVKEEKKQGEEQSLYNNRSHFIRVAIERELRRYKEYVRKKRT